MGAKHSLESLLQTLVNAPDSEKVSVVSTILKALREACGLYKRSSSSDCQEAARTVQEILDGILSDSIQIEDEEWEDEFAESGMEFEETIAATRAKISIPESEIGTPDHELKRVNAEWNAQSSSWLKLPDVNINNTKSTLRYVHAIAAARSNIISNSFDDQAKVLSRIDKHWEKVTEILKKGEYQISPSSFNTSAEPRGRVIYACRSRITEPEVELIVPGVNHNEELLSEQVWIVGLSPEAEFPREHPKASLPAHWRGIFGELDLLLAQLEIQSNAYSAIEGINKNKVDSLEETRGDVIAELARRNEVLSSSILKGDEESLYILATNYWRVEEYFWSIFHEDERPAGCSCFDRLRNRVQGWRTILRKVLKLHIRDFSCGSDSLASINKYIGNIIIKPKKNTPAGTVTRELRPAIMVKVQGTNRLLKGRVIAT